MIGLIGANGKIGSEIVKALHELVPDEDIKLGCRRPPVDSQGLWQVVDITETTSLKDFGQDCSILINASGGTPALLPELPFVELGSQNNFSSITDKPILYGCGSVPGVIGMIPRVLSETVSPIKRLRMDYLINEPLSMTAAFDMTESYSLPSGNAKKAQMSASVPECVPFIGDEVYRYRFSDAETRGIDRILNVKNSEWSMVRESDDLEQIFTMQFTSRQELAEKLYTSSHIQRQGLENSIQFLTELQGDKMAVTCFAKCSNPSALSGKTCAAAAVAVLQGKIRNGVSLLSLSDDWKAVWELIMQTKPFDVWMVYPCCMDKIMEEEGEL